MKTPHQFNQPLKPFLGFAFACLLFAGLLVLSGCSDADAPNNIQKTEDAANGQQEARGVKEAPLPTGPQLNQNRL